MEKFDDRRERVKHNSGYVSLPVVVVVGIAGSRYSSNQAESDGELVSLSFLNNLFIYYLAPGLVHFHSTFRKKNRRNLYYIFLNQKIFHYCIFIALKIN